MREIEYTEANFKEVLRLSEVCERSIGTDRPQQIHFNEITNKFEYYSPEEFDSIPQDVLFEHPKNAIDKYLERKNQIANAVAETDNYQGPVEVNDETFPGYTPEEVEHMQEEAAPDSLDPIFDNDDPEVLEATTQNLKVIRDIQAKLQTEQRERLSRVIADLYKCDIISESDVAQSLVENNEFKKLLSMLFSMLGVTVSSTRVSKGLDVSSATLSFNPKIEYGLEDYRRGAAQCLADVRQLRESGERIKTLEETVRDQNITLTSVRKELAAAEDKYLELQNQRTLKKEQNLVEPVSCVIAWKKGDSFRYLTVKEKAKSVDDGTYPTKYLSKTSSVDKAFIFTEELARLQIERLVKYRKNLTFVELKDTGNKEASEFFSIHRTTIEKV